MILGWLGFLHIGLTTIRGADRPSGQSNLLDPRSQINEAGQSGEENTGKRGHFFHCKLHESIEETHQYIERKSEIKKATDSKENEGVVPSFEFIAKTAKFEFSFAVVQTVLGKHAEPHSCCPIDNRDLSLPIDYKILNGENDELYKCTIEQILENEYGCGYSFFLSGMRFTRWGRKEQQLQMMRMMKKSLSMQKLAVKRVQMRQWLKKVLGLVAMQSAGIVVKRSNSHTSRKEKKRPLVQKGSLAIYSAQLGRLASCWGLQFISCVIIFKIQSNLRPSSSTQPRSIVVNQSTELSPLNMVIRYLSLYRYNIISMKQDEKTFKMIIIGPAGVGKSCLLNRFTKDEFRDGYTATLGVQFYSKEIIIDQNTSVKMQIWDTAGMQSFRSIIKTFYRSSAAVFLVYNIANKASFEELEHWYTEAIENCTEDAVFALIGAQKDRQFERMVSYDIAQKFMRDKDLAFMFQTSAKTSQNVQTAFREAAKQIILKKISGQINQKGLGSSPRPTKKCEC